MIANVIKKMFNEVKKSINKNFNIILLIIYLIFSGMQIYFHEYYDENIWMIMSICLAIFIGIMGKFHQELEKEKKIKLKPKERYTIKHSNGNISIKEGKLYQAIIFLSRLEDEIW